MLIAKPNEDNTFIVADYKSLFPEWCFNVNGPEDDWFTSVGCYRVKLTKLYNTETEMLENCEPYLEDGRVYTVRVVPIPVEEPTQQI